ncbi:hypothetical protein CP533_6351 [Ophiocordyceps camponoti-saundersi (nom. inval.)]|nr:hypothetical protein CP533_6351 [Ophiocordyceps camponoti-saundersi (nom. inval.)]
MPAPQVEEVSDSDPDVPDPDEDDIEDLIESDVLVRRRDQPLPPPATAARTTPTAPQGERLDPSAFRNFQCLYPIYFDATRSRRKGRRVSRSKAVENPLARTMADACSRLGLKTVLEMNKTHPKDWSNPGRVRIELSASPSIRNKHQLYVLVASHLAANPTTEASPGLMMNRQLGFDGLGRGGEAADGSSPYPRPAVPRGVKMGELLPWISPALTGGGVSENLFGDMMREMQQQQQPQVGDDEPGRRRKGKARMS